MEPIRWLSVRLFPKSPSTDALVFTAVVVYAPAVNAAPVIPNFKQGTMTSHTETTSKVTETIVSENYSTGFEYSASGVNVAPSGAINPVSNTTVNGWTSLSATQLVNRQARRSIPIRRKSERARVVERHDDPTNNRDHKRYRHSLFLQRIAVAIGIIFCAPVNANDIGGISATASPTATSSGSVSNQAVQILQGSAITNTYGGNISVPRSNVNRHAIPQPHQVMGAAL